MSVKSKKEKEARSDQDLKKSAEKVEPESASSSKAKESGVTSRKSSKSKPRQPRRPRRRFTRKDANTVGKELGARYLFLAVLGLFCPPLAPAAWLLSQSLRSFADRENFLLNNRVYAAWVIGLVATIFYAFFCLLIIFFYITVPGYSLV